jgi:hypothetical protein
MQLRTYPDFGKGLQRPFIVHENCCDCAGFYDGCVAWPQSKPFACHSYNPLPDVLAETCGQRFPATARKLTAVPADSKVETRLMPSTPMEHSRPSQQSRRPSPIARRGLSGERLCECGATLQKRKRCCNACRLKRREETLYQHKCREARSTVVDTGSGLPFAGSGTLSTRARIPAHNY